MANPNGMSSMEPELQAASASERRWTEILVGVGMAAVLLVCALGWRISPDDAVVAANPQAIAGLHGSIGYVARTSMNGGTLEIVLDEGAPGDEADALTDLARMALTISHDLKERFPNEPSRNVVFVARLPVQGLERYVTAARVLSLTFRCEDLMAADYDERFKFQDLLNLVQRVEYARPEQRRLVRDFCNNSSARLAARFCQRETGDA